jgi:hypothetical protein
MRLLFFVNHPGALRLLEPPVRALAERGHSVELAFDTVKTGSSLRLAERVATELPGITVTRVPRGRDAWSPFLERLRLTIDYLRYHDPAYAKATKLRARAAAQAPGVATRIGKLPQPLRRAFGHALRRLERCIDPPAVVESFIRAREPDLVLVTPLVGLGSRQADYLRAARRLGIRTAFPVLSWDNLTNKGLLRDEPDLVLVWNEEQAREATELHDVHPERVAVTGAAAFDHWFSWTPSLGRDAFAAATGLRADRPILLYVCSSPFIAPDEAEFVKDWIAALRREGGVLSEVGILVRPHPQNAAQWALELLSDDQVAVWPRRGEDPLDDAARRNYFDSIFHSSVVIGINTSALIESSIVGRRVHTITADRYRDVQEGTLHFGYLAGSVLTTAATLEEHAVKLREALVLEPEHDEGGDAFLRRFIRPHGLDEPATARVVEELEQLLLTPAPARARAPLVAPLVRSVLRPAAAQARRSARRAKAARSARATTARMPDVLAPVLDSSEPVLAGPWLSEVGFELLYWIPFLRHAVERDPTLAARLTVVSRGGTASWYDGIAEAGYVELFDYVSPSELADELNGRVAAGVARKQFAVQPFDDRLVKRIVLERGLKRPTLLHPAAMYQAYWFLVKQGLLPAQTEIFRFERLVAPTAPAELRAVLPEDYFAVRFYFNASFPATRANRAVAAEVVESLLGRAPVVLLDPKTRFDDHDDLELDALPGVVRIDDLLSPATNLEAQTAVVAGSRAFVGTYGGLSYLPPFLGVSSLAFYSDPGRFRAQHLEVAQRAFRRDSFGSLLALDARDLELVRAVAGGGVPTIS